MTNPPEGFTVDYQPLRLEYRDFIRCNDLCFVDEPISEDEFKRYRSGDFWAAYAGNSLIGYGIMTASRNKRRIERIAICPEHRCKTYGQRLLSTMMEHGIDAGCEEFVLSVQQDNPVAIHIYKKAGFNIVSESCQYIVDVGNLANSAEHTNDAYSYEIAPIIEVDPESLPKGMQRWYDSYSYPNRQVLLFSQLEIGFIGFCRLNPDFPGCSPFEVWQQDFKLNELLILLDDYLVDDKRRIKLMFTNAQIAIAAEKEGYTLNYKLFEMSLNRRKA